MRGSTDLEQLIEDMSAPEQTEVVHDFARRLQELLRQGIIRENVLTPPEKTDKT